MVKLSHNPSGLRTYKCGTGSVAVPSVTEIIKVTEGNWINAYIARVGRREADRVLREAAVLGTKVHALAERLAHNPEYQPPEESMRGFAKAIREFLKVHVRRVVETELSLASDVLGYGGTCDLYCELQDGTLAVVDFKTSAGGLTRINGLQLSGYALLLRESGRTVNKRICVLLHKDPEKVGKWYARNYANHIEDTETFLAAKTLWYFLHKNKLLKAAA